jgi:hypothetical protein
MNRQEIRIITLLFDISKSAQLIINWLEKYNKNAETQSVVAELRKSKIEKS